MVKKFWQDFGGDPSLQSSNPTRAEVKEWNKETDKLNKDIAKKKKRLVKGSKWNPIKAVSAWKTLIESRKLKGNLLHTFYNVSKDGRITGERTKKRADRIAQATKNKQWLNAKRVKQVLPIVGRTIGAASGWGTLIAGVSLLAQTKKAKTAYRRFKTYNTKTSVGSQYHPEGYSKNYLIKGPFNPFKGQWGEQHYNRWNRGTKPQKIKHFPAQRKNN